MQHLGGSARRASVNGGSCPRQEAQLAGPRKLYPGKCAGPSHYFREEGRGGKVLLKMAREPQKELQLSPGALRGASPVTGGGRADARRKAAGGGAAAAGRGGPGTPAIFTSLPSLPSLPRTHAPASAAATPGSRGDNAGLRLAARHARFASP